MVDLRGHFVPSIRNFAQLSVYTMPRRGNLNVIIFIDLHLSVSTLKKNLYLQYIERFRPFRLDVLFWGLDPIYNVYS